MMRINHFFYFFLPPISTAFLIFGCAGSSAPAPGGPTGVLYAKSTVTTGDSSIIADSVMGEFLQPYREQVERVMQLPLSTKPFRLAAASRELYDFVAGGVYLSVTLDQQSLPDLAIVDSRLLMGGLMADTVRLADLHALIPFDDDLLSVKMTANGFRRLLDAARKHKTYCLFGPALTAEHDKTKEYLLIINARAALAGQSPLQRLVSGPASVLPVKLRKSLEAPLKCSEEDGNETP